MFTISDIMTANPITLQTAHTLKNAHDLMSLKKIRHLPIADDEGRLVGILTHREMISKVIHIMTEFGTDRLIEQEMKTPVMDVAITDYSKVHTDDSLLSIAEFFIDHKHGCLPVMNRQEQLVGILTSSDFVKLSIKLLEGDSS